MKNSNVFRCLSSALMTLGLVSCGPASPEGSRLSGISASSLTGVWAKRMSSLSESSALGVSSQSGVTRINLLTLQVQDGQVLVQEQPCDLKAENKGSSSISFPPAFAKSLPTRNYSYQISGGEQVDGLRLNKAVEVFGAQLQDPLAEALPTSASDSRVVDQDKDGNPGMTVDVSVKVLLTVRGAIYVSQRQIWDEELFVVNADRLEGRYLWASEQSILGSSNSLFTSVKPTVTPLLDQSSIELLRLPEGSGCAAALARF